MYQCVTVDGADAFDFLQAQFTQDLKLLADARSLPTAWCNAGGRVVVTLRLVGGGDGFGLIVPQAVAPDLIARMQTYRLRSKVTFATCGDDWRSLAAAGPAALQALERAGLLPPAGFGNARAVQGVTAIELGTADRVVEVFGNAAALSAQGLEDIGRLTDDAWRNARVRAGLPDIGPETTEKYTPHMLNLDLCGYLSFDKGCYPGQEVVARTEHLGRSRRRLSAWHCETPVAVGDRLSHDGSDVGAVVNAAGGSFLAVTPTALHGETLDVGGVAAAPLALPYAIPAD